MATSTIRLKNDPAQISALVAGVEQFGETLGLAPATIAELNLILEELVVNIISYGYDDDAEHEIVVALTRSGGMLHIRIEDDGKPFNPLEAPEPDLDQPMEDRPIGGLGIHLVKNLTSRIEYRREEGKNVLCMDKDC